MEVASVANAMVLNESLFRGRQLKVSPSLSFLLPSLLPPPSPPPLLSPPLLSPSPPSPLPSSPPPLPPPSSLLPLLTVLSGDLEADERSLLHARGWRRRQLLATWRRRIPTTPIWQSLRSSATWQVQVTQGILPSVYVICWCNTETKRRKRTKI